MITDEMLFWVVPSVFIFDLILTLAVKLKKLDDINLVALTRFITFILGGVSSWLLFFDVPSQGVLHDYLFGSVLLYYIPLRLVLIR
ncbi:hypothetical protein JL49_24620 [Pseudoalteromonas luteoviolacea]|nr:hypothetical protein JL49_24620 [Pseudoalteromonas luteoviolacea]